MSATDYGEARTFVRERARGPGVFAFKAGVLAAMITPPTLYSLHTLFAQYAFWRPCVLLVTLWGLTSDGHVFATGYLYLRPRNFDGIRHRWTRLYVIPIAIVCLNLWAVMMLPASELMWFMIAYVHHARVARRSENGAFPGSLIAWYALMPCLALIAAALTGAVLWRHPELPFAGFTEIIQTIAGAGSLAKAGAGLVAGITLAHFWVDQFIWRLRTPERRGWLLENYPFLASRS